jgi:hypothetical protein
VAVAVFAYFVVRGDRHSSAAEPASPTPVGSASRACTPTAATTPRATPLPRADAFAAGGKHAAPIDVRVTVLNGSGTFGQAESVLSWLQNDRHFLRASNGGPAAHTQAATSLVYAPAHVDQARTLVAALGLPESALHATGKDRSATGRMVLTLGQDFHGIGKPFAAPVPTASVGTGCGGP